MNNYWTSTTIPIGEFTKAQAAFQTAARPSLARRLLGRIAAVGLALVRRGTSAPAPAEIVQPDRVILPMSSGVNIKTNTSATITSRPQNTAFHPTKVIIGGSPGDWVINDIRVGRKSQFVHSGDVPGEVFAADAFDNVVRFDVVLTAMDFTIVVTYIGDNPDGAPFSCGVLGDAAYLVPATAQPEPRGLLARGVEAILSEIMEPNPDTAMIQVQNADSKSLRLVLPMSSGTCIKPNTTAQITGRSQETFRPERIILGGHSSDWIINDIKIGHRSQFSQSGDVPGEMFTATTIDSFVRFETVQVAMDFSILATYIGDKSEGEQFVCGVLGTVPSLV